MSGMAVLGLVATPLTPLLCMLIWLSPRLRSRGERVLPWAALPALATALLAPTDTVLVLDALLLQGASWSLAGPAKPMLLVTALVWLAASHYARGYLAHSAHRDRFHLLWLATMAGNLGLIAVDDMASFYTFFALMTFAAYGLIVHQGDAAAMRAGRVYLAMALMGEVLLLAGLLLAAGQMEIPRLSGVAAVLREGDHRHAILGLLIAGLGVKAGLPLLHMWLPLAHPAAPTPASAVLSGAMIKAGLLGWLRLLPLGILAIPFWGWLLVMAGGVAAFGAALIGITQRDPKAVLAYSSVSQMGLMTILVGAGLLAPVQWSALEPAIVLFAVHHGVAKGALFLGVGVARAHRGGPAWLVWMALLVPALALAAAPFTGGALAKQLAKDALYGTDGWLHELPMVLAWSSLATAALMARFLWQLRGEFDAARGSRTIWQGWLTLAALTVCSPLWLAAAVDGAARPEGAFDMSHWWGGLWPILVVLAISWILTRRAGRHWQVPPGDVLCWFERPLAGLVAVGRRSGARCARAAGRVGRELGKAGRAVYRGGEHALNAEELASRCGGLAFIALLLLLSLLLL